MTKSKGFHDMCQNDLISVGSLVEIRNNFMTYDTNDGMHAKRVDEAVMTGLVIGSKSLPMQGGYAVTYTIFTNDEIRLFSNTMWDIIAI